jgi:L-fuconolactonase
MRIDAHVHFMVYDPHEHVWVTDELSALKRNFLPADLEPLLKGAGFDGCVAVQARQLPHENEWLLDLARSHGCIRGIVGWAATCSGRDGAARGADSSPPDQRLSSRPDR